MTADPIVEEIHKIRAQLLAEYNGDFDAFFADCQRRTEEAARAGKKVYAPPPRPAEGPAPAKRAG